MLRRGALLLVVTAIAVAVAVGVGLGLVVGPSRAVATTVFRTTTVVQTVTSTETVPLTLTTTITVTRKPSRVAVVDALGRTVWVPVNATRVVSLAPSISEELFALGLGDRVVGVDDYSNYPPELARAVEEGRIDRVGGYWSPDLEKIVELKPDLVLADASAQAKLLEKFEELNLTVVYLRASGCKSLNDVYSDISLLGLIFGAERAARELEESIKHNVTLMVNALVEANATRRRVLVLLGPPSWGLWTAGGGTYLDELIGLAGGVNVAGKYHGWVQLSLEEALASNPEVIIVAMMGSREGAEKVLEEVKEMFNSTVAVREGRVYVFTGWADDVLCRPGPRVTWALALLARAIHPEVFGEPRAPCIVGLGGVSGG